MSLTTLTQCSPQICSRLHTPSLTHFLAEHHPPPSTSAISWQRVLHATCVAGIATVLSQLVATPIDVGIRLSRDAAPNISTNLFTALFSTVRKKGFSAAFAGLHLHALKRLPTKTLTVALFELGTQVVSHGDRSRLSAPQHMAIALSSGVSAIMATYPLHFVYYAARKGFTFGSVVQCARVQPRILYSGALPAVLSRLPSAMVDYMMYRSLRQRINDGDGNGAITAAAIVAAATSSNLMGGFFSEPFKLLSKKMAVESVQSASCGSLSKTVADMMRGGVGEFWRGFPVKSLRYTVSAVVSKTTVQRLRKAEPQVVQDPQAPHIQHIPQAPHLPQAPQAPARQAIEDGIIGGAPTGKALVGSKRQQESFRISRRKAYFRRAI